MSDNEADSLRTYEVRLSEPAEIEIEAAYLGRMRFGLEAADRWYAGLAQALAALAQLPRRYPLAPESEALGGEVRQMIHGTGGGAYRVLYRVLEPEEASPGIVRILHIRHATRDRPGPASEADDRP